MHFVMKRRWKRKRTCWRKTCIAKTRRQRRYTTIWSVDWNWMAVYVTRPTCGNRKMSQNWIGHLVQLSWVWSGAVIISTSSTQLNSTQLDTAKCWESQNLPQLDQLSWDESRVVIPIGLNSTSWDELSPVRRCDQGLR